MSNDGADRDCPNSKDETVEPAAVATTAGYASRSPRNSTARPSRAGMGKACRTIAPATRPGAVAVVEPDDGEPSTASAAAAAPMPRTSTGSDQGKARRTTTTAMVPGAVAVVEPDGGAMEPASAHSMGGSRGMGGSSRGKTRRTTAPATVPGAVSVIEPEGAAVMEPAASAAAPTMMRGSNNSTGKACGTNAPAATPGAVSVATEPEGAAMEPAAAATLPRGSGHSTGSARRTTAPAAMPGAVSVSEPEGAAMQPGAASTPRGSSHSRGKGKTRQTTAPASTPGAVAVVEPDGMELGSASAQPDGMLGLSACMTGKSRRATAATVPGAVSVAEPAENGNVEPETTVMPGPTTVTARTSQFGKARGTAAVQSGAVAVVEKPTSEPSEPGALTATGAAPRATSNHTMESLMMQQPGASSMGSKARWSGTPATVPGAVAETSSSQAANTASASGLPAKPNHRGPVAFTPGDASVASTASTREPKLVVQMVEQDALAKRRNANRGPPPSAPGVHSVSGQRAEQMNASVAQKANNGAPPPVTDRVQAKIAKENRRLRGNQPNRAEQEARNQKMVQKLKQTEREQEARDERSTAAAEGREPAHTSANKYAVDRTNDMFQEKEGRSSAPPPPSQPTIPEPTAEHPFPHLTLRPKQPEEPVMEAVPTTAYRGVAVAPDVEYGQIAQAPEDDGLAVALLIEDEEDYVYYPAAVVYDPDAKPPLYKNRRCRLYAFLGCMIVLGIVVAVPVVVVVGGGGGKTIIATDPPTMAPTATPTSVEQGRVVEQLRTELNFEFEEIGTPQNMALRWILDEDPRGQTQNQSLTQRYLVAEASNLLQRYLLALFYFSTSNMTSSNWRSCNPPGRGENETCTFIEFTRLENDTVTYVPREETRWLSAAHECDWAGIFCFEDQEVRVVELFGQQLQGTLPTELVNLPLLQSIALPYNEFTGTLSDVFAAARHLRNLEVHGNLLEGTIPELFFDSEELANFNVGENMLSGTISPQLSRWSNLKGFHVSENNFEGTIPTEMGLLSVLSFTRVDRNLFTGTLPTQLGRLTLLEEIWYQENNFTSTLPNQAVQGWRRLTDLRVNGNELTGPIPDSVYNLPFLQRLHLHDNKFTGTLSTHIGTLQYMEDLKLRNNQLIGTIPTEMANMPSLLLAWFHLNLFNGTVPDELCSRRGLEADGKLEFLEADCDPEGAAATPCSCCSACCDRNTGLCTERD